MYEYTDEDMAIVDQILELKKKNDREGAHKLMQTLLLPAETLMAEKKLLGAEALRKKNYRMDLAEEKYGKDWLDR